MKERQGTRVSHPEYYQANNGTELLDVIEDLPFWKGSAIKYIFRAGNKTEEGLSDNEKTKEDLRKAIFYIKHKLASLCNEEQDSH